MNPTQIQLDSKSALIRAKDALQRSSKISREALLLANRFDSKSNKIGLHRVEAARRSIRSGLHLMCMSADALNKHGDADAAAEMRFEIEEIQKHLARIDELAEALSQGG